jgi:hypothetical protein
MGITETVPLSVASTDPPAVGSLQAQVTETAPLVATSSSVPAPVVQTQTTSQPRASSEGQPDSLESEKDTSQFVITPRSSAPDLTPSVPRRILRFVEFIFIINLFRDINIARIFYKSSETYCAKK